MGSRRAERGSGTQLQAEAGLGELRVAWCVDVDEPLARAMRRSVWRAYRPELLRHGVRWPREMVELVVAGMRHRAAWIALAAFIALSLVLGAVVALLARSLTPVWVGLLFAVGLLFLLTLVLVVGLPAVRVGGGWRRSRASMREQVVPGQVRVEVQDRALVVTDVQGISSVVSGVRGLRRLPGHAVLSGEGGAVVAVPLPPGEDGSALAHLVGGPIAVPEPLPGPATTWTVDWFRQQEDAVARAGRADLLRPYRRMQETMEVHDAQPLSPLQLRYDRDARRLEAPGLSLPLSVVETLTVCADVVLLRYARGQDLLTSLRGIPEDQFAALTADLGPARVEVVPVPSAD